MALRLTITLQDNGQLQIDGPIHDKLICYGVLEAARQAIQSYQPPRVQPASVIPSIGPTGRAG